MSTRERTGPAHSAAGDRRGWGPTPRSRRSYTARRDSRSMTALRATAYVLTSLASVAFLVLAGFVAVQYLPFPGRLLQPGPVASKDVRTVDGCTAGPTVGCAPSPQLPADAAP